MLVLYRKCGQGVGIEDVFNGNRFSFLFRYNKDGFSFYEINGVYCKIVSKSPFYIDNEKKIMAIIFQCDKAIRVGIDAPHNFKIKRLELDD